MNCTIIERKLPGVSAVNNKKEKKIIAFPGMVERLLVQAEMHVDQYEYKKAVELLEQAFQHEEPDAQYLGMYAYCLYEIKQYEQSKIACETLLEQNPPHYFEVMELYLTVCMQLKQFKQVEKLIESMKKERIIPPEQQEKFDRLQALNANVSQLKEQQEKLEEPVNKDEWFEVETFIRLAKEEQLIVIQQLTERNIRPITNELVNILQHEQTHPFVKSLILILLVEQEVSAQVTLSKFGETVVVDTKSLPLPTSMPKFIALTEELYDVFEQEPSTLEMVQFMLSKHAIVMYPFDYLDYELDDLVQGYIDFVRLMFGEMRESDVELQHFLHELEKLSDMQ